MTNLKEKIHLEMYKEMYAKEVERVGHVTSRLQWSISVWIILFGGIVYVFNSYGNMKVVIDHFYVTLSLAALCSLISMGLILWGLYDTKIKHLPQPTVLRRRYKDIRDYYAVQDKNKFDIHQGLVEEEFERQLEDLYISTTDDIMKKNDKRILFSHYANIFMMVSGIFLLITFAFMVVKLIK